MLVFIVYVPDSHVDVVKDAMFDAGAGQIGNYSRCAWQVLGQGQFQPGSGAAPFTGEVDALSFESEYRIEMVCSERVLENVLKAMRDAHPYEEPAFHVLHSVV